MKLEHNWTEFRTKLNEIRTKLNEIRTNELKLKEQLELSAENGGMSSNGDGKRLYASLNRQKM
jgi:hypothetical protein